MPLGQVYIYLYYTRVLPSRAYMRLGRSLSGAKELVDLDLSSRGGNPVDRVSLSFSLGVVLPELNERTHLWMKRAARVYYLAARALGSIKNIREWASRPTREMLFYLWKLTAMTFRVTRDRDCFGISVEFPFYLFIPGMWFFGWYISNKFFRYTLVLLNTYDF